MDAPFSILVVCYANVCRSPLATYLLEAWAAEAGLREVVSVRSAGTHGEAGAPMCEGARGWAQAPTPPRSVALSRDMLEQSDLVLAADREVANSCAVLDPASRPRLFTLSQAALLAAAVADSPETASGMRSTFPAGRLRWAVAEMDAVRYLLGGVPDEAEEIADRHGPWPHEEVFEEVDVAVSALCAAFDRFVNSDPI